MSDTADIAIDTRLALSDGIVFRELDGEAVILNMSTGVYFGLDEVGTRLWQLVVDGGTVAAAADIIRTEYDVDEETLRRDLLALARDLHARGLLRVDAAPPSP